MVVIDGAWIGAAAVVTGVVMSAVTGEWQARRRFGRERVIASEAQGVWILQQWWQRKADTYSQTIDILQRIVARDMEYLRQEEMEDLNEALLRSVELDWPAERKALRRQVDMGTFYMSEVATEILKEYFKYLYAPSRFSNHYEALASDYSASTKCLEDFTKAASNDLRIGKVPSPSSPPQP